MKRKFTAKDLRYCGSMGRHWFTTYGAMERVDYCVRCRAPKAEVLKAQRDAAKRKKK